MELKSLNEYFERAEIPDNMAAEKRDDILKFIATKGVCYPTEIARENNLHPEIVNRILFELHKNGFIQKVYPPEDPDCLFRSRIPEMWALGVQGYHNFLRFSWWCLTEAGLEYLKARFKGQGITIRAGLMHYLNLESKEKNGK